jgi:hypothetical protein
MNDPTKNPPVLEYGKEAEKSSWPALLYLGAVVWAFLTMIVFTASLDGRENNLARVRAQIALSICAILRLGWALYKKEKGLGWVSYITLFFSRLRSGSW